ncbi:DUF6238 family protein [Streptomyces sp. NBC_01244]|uniref:DUF6238 family protein n=1 Tax=Streptomyces sp. NBC_01244 TaxID=2903797 RepID=UPI002E10473D|nr:DUF6238 family protein [Streptomyces sp. NBC_01244]
MTPPTPLPDSHPYLRAATAGIRHHTRGTTTSTPAPAVRAHLDTVHAHLTALHQLLDKLADTTRTTWPTAGRHLAGAHTRLWQAAAEVHDAFHTLPATTAAAPGAAEDCDPNRLPEGPPVLTICQRHLTAGHAIRRKTTPADLRGHVTHCGR